MVRVTDLAAKIAAALRDGITHPGDKGKGLPPRPIMLPFKGTAGMPQEMADLMTATTNLLGEAIVHLIEQSHDIVAKGLVTELQSKVDAKPYMGREVSVHCNCDRDRANPLVIFDIDTDPIVVIDGKRLIEVLSKRTIECPHEVKK